MPDHRFLDVLHEADRLARTNPAALLDVHLAHLAHYVTPRELDAIRERRAAAVVERRDKAFHEAQLRTADPRQVNAPAIDAARLSTMSFQEICKAYPDAPATLGLVGDVMTFMLSMNENNKARNARLDALEAANQKLQERILELEANAAAVRA